MVHTGAGSRSHLETFGIDRLRADHTHAIRFIADSSDCRIDFGEMLPELVGHGPELGALKSDCLTLWVMFVIGVGVARGFDEPVHVFVQ